LSYSRSFPEYTRFSIEVIAGSPLIEAAIILHAISISVDVQSAELTKWQAGESRSLKYSLHGSR